MKKIVVWASNAAALVLFTGWAASAAPQNLAEIRSHTSAGEDRPLITKVHPASPMKTEPRDCGATAGGGPVVFDQPQETAKSASPAKPDR